MVGEEDGTGIVFTICFVEYWWKNIQLNRLTFVQIVYSSQPEGNGRHHSWNVPRVRQSSQSLKCRQWCERVAEVQGAFEKLSDLFSLPKGQSTVFLLHSCSSFACKQWPSLRWRLLCIKSRSDQWGHHSYFGTPWQKIVHGKDIP